MFIERRFFVQILSFKIKADTVSDTQNDKGYIACIPHLIINFQQPILCARLRQHFGMSTSCQHQHMHTNANEMLV